jgi:acetyl-CoA synthetase
VLRAVFENKDPGDLFALANPEAVDLLREKTCRNANAGRPE